MSYAPAVWNTDIVHEGAYIAACELVGPNDIEFDDVCERMIDLMFAKYGARHDLHDDHVATAKMHHIHNDHAAHVAWMDIPF